MNIKKRVDAAVGRYFSGFKADRVVRPARAMLVIDVDYHFGWRPESVVSDREKQAVAAALINKITITARSLSPCL